MNRYKITCELIPEYGTRIWEVSESKQENTYGTGIYATKRCINEKGLNTEYWDMRYSGSEQQRKLKYLEHFIYYYEITTPKIIFDLLKGLSFI